MTVCISVYMTVFSNQTYIFRLSGNSPKVANAKKKKEGERENETNKKETLVPRIKVYFTCFTLRK